MTTDDLVKLVEVLPAIKAIQGGPDRTDIEKYATFVANEVATEFDWDFVVSDASFTTTDSTAEYTLTGNSNDCRDVINLRFADADGTTIKVLRRLRPVDMDSFQSERSITEIGWWYVSGRSRNGFPKVTIVGTPDSDEDTIYYRYRRKNISVEDFPDEFGSVLRDGLIAKFLPSYRPYYRNSLNIMIDRYAAAGGDADPARLSDKNIYANNRRYQLYGF